MTVRTTSEIIESFKKGLQQLNSRLANFNPFSNISILFRSIASVISEHEVELDNIKQGFYLSTAVGEALDKRAVDFNLYRKPGSPSVGNVLVKVNSNSLSVIIPAKTILTTVGNSLQIETSEAITPYTVEVPLAVQSLSLSAEANLLPGTKLYSNLYPNVSFEVGNFRNILTNTIEGGLTNGRAQETDDQFKERIQRYLLNLPQGTYDALSNAILAIPSVTKVFIKEHAPITGYLTVYVNSNNLAILRRVSLITDEYKAAGVAFVVKTLQQRSLNIAIDIELNRTANIETTTTEIRDRIYSLTDSINIGGSLSPEAIAGSVLQVNNIKNVKVVNPTEGIALRPEEALVVTGININTVINR